MNRALKSALYELKNEGVTLDPIEDLEHIVTLHTLALAISAPRALPGEAALLRPALCIGNVTLYRLSLGARRFLADVVDAWFPRDSHMQDLSYAYAMAIGHEPEKLWAVQSDRRAFRDAVRAWEKTVGVPFDQLAGAVRAFLDEERSEPGPTPGPAQYRAALATLDRWRPLPEPYLTECQAALVALRVEQEAEPVRYGPNIARLSRECGRSPEDLLWRTSEAELELLLSHLRENQDAEERAVTGAHDERFLRAHKAFCDYKSMVLRIKKGAAT
jgi:hypothetical protein